VAVTALTTAVAAAGGVGFPRLVLLSGAVLTGQLSIGWSNDLLDRERDRAAARRDKPVGRGDVTPRTVQAATAVALALCVLLSLACGLLAGLMHLVAVSGGWAYNLGLKRTVLSFLPYAVSFGLLTAFATLAAPAGEWPEPWAVAAGSLLGLGAHFLNVVPDVRDDLAAGIRGLPQRLGSRASAVIGAALLAAAGALVLLGPVEPLGIAGWVGLVIAVGSAVGAGLAGLRPGASRLPFLLALVTAAVAVTALVARGGTLT
jgi:4-hydroxybenzoate polyprenyltransferase